MSGGPEDHAQKEAREAKLVFARIKELNEQPIRGPFDLDHLRAVHAHIFTERNKPMPISARLPRMNVALRKPMTQDQFFQWAEAQDGRYEFDGEQPVAMTGGTYNHGIISRNIVTQLGIRLRGRPCRVLPAEGPGVATIGRHIRYPDATVTCSPARGSDRLIPNPVIVFEVVSPRNAQTDRHDKMHEYHAVPSIRRYLLIEQNIPVLTSYLRLDGEPWVATSLSFGDTLALPEIDAEIPIAEIFDEVDFDEPPTD